MGLAGVAWGLSAEATVLSAASLILPLVACLCGNIYIVGLNQLEDIEIDRINKPHLPIASGEFSKRLGTAIVLLTGGLALLLSAWGGAFLWATVWSSLAIGTVYSLPPIRLKRFPVWASLCIFSVRGAIVNLGLFLHFNQQLGHSPQIPAPVWALTLFVLAFTLRDRHFQRHPRSGRRSALSDQHFHRAVGAKSRFRLGALGADRLLCRHDCGGDGGLQGLIRLC